MSTDIVLIAEFIIKVLINNIFNESATQRALHTSCNKSDTTHVMITVKRQKLEMTTYRGLQSTDQLPV